MNALHLPAPTAFPALDAVLRRLKDGSRAFVRLPIDARISLARRMAQGYAAIAEESAAAACVAKGIDPASPLAGEELIAGPMVTHRILRLTVDALEDIKRHGAPRI